MKTIAPARALALLLAGAGVLAPPAAAQAGKDGAAINRYISGLQYDPHRILTVTSNGARTAMPGLEKGKDSVIICTTKQKPLNKDLEEVTILSPSANTLFPGALVRANRNLAEGRPDLVTLARAPITVSVDLNGLEIDGQAKIADPTLTTVRAGLQKIQETWFNKKLGQAARFTYEMAKAYTSEQLAIALKINSKSAMGTLFKVDSSAAMAAERSVTVALFKQTYFTATFDPPADAADYFTTQVTEAQVRSRFDAANPPAYVKSMDYGRIILVRMETASSEDEQDLNAALQFATGGTDGPKMESALQEKYRRILANSTFTVLILGGNATDATKLLDGGKATGEALYKLIRGSAKFDRNNPAYPIAYTVNFLKDNSLATISLSTDYTETSCTEYPNGYVTFINKGGFLARFWVVYQYHGPDGKTLVKGEWQSKWETAPYTHTEFLPGDARDIVVFGEEDTGFGYKEVFRKKWSTPPNLCYKLKGTTLMPKWSNECD
jgi:thiol-activated cytolysin